MNGMRLRVFSSAIAAAITASAIAGCASHGVSMPMQPTATQPTVIQPLHAGATKDVDFCKNSNTCRYSGKIDDSMFGSGTIVLVVHQRGKVIYGGFNPTFKNQKAFMIYKGIVKAGGGTSVNYLLNMVRPKDNCLFDAMGQVVKNPLAWTLSGSFKLIKPCGKIQREVGLFSMELIL